ncbi:MAG: Rrf2 family transcriptional regulator, partial [Gammaproteobacteria bacterium]|nr:Rrf2 family transcriptional regulator [Gammaproteobacteria bacterium]
MKLSTKARHAITAMMDLAINDNYKPVTLADISQCQGISLSYLEQLFAKLRKSGLVVGVRGPGGGYRLSRSPNEISVAQVLSSIDENVQPQQE